MNKHIKHISRHYTLFRRQPSTWIERHPFVLPVVLFIVVFVSSLVAVVGLNAQTVGASDAKVVNVYVEGTTRTIPTRAQNVEEVLRRLNIEVGEEDIVEPALDTPIDEDDFGINVYRARPVIINQNGHKTTIITAEQSPRVIAKKAGLTIYPEDIVQLDRSDEELRQGILGQKLVVIPATPVVINLYGSPIPVRTQKSTVSEVLAEHNIKVSSNDTVVPNKDSKIAANSQILITRFGQKIETEEIVIDPPTKTVDDPNAVAGQVKVIEPGKPGKKLVTYQIDLKNEQVLGRKQIQEVVLVQPVERVVSRGTKLLAALTGDKTSIMAAAGVAPSDYSYADHIISRESGWCATKWQGRPGVCPAYYEQLHDPSSGYGYGLCQSTPAIKMATAGSDWQTNAVTQMKWCSNYAKKYGGWAGAYNFWLVNHWW